MGRSLLENVTPSILQQSVSPADFGEQALHWLDGDDVCMACERSSTGQFPALIPHVRRNRAAKRRVARASCPAENGILRILMRQSFPIRGGFCSRDKL